MRRVLRFVVLLALLWGGFAGYVAYMQRHGSGAPPEPLPVSGQADEIKVSKADKRLYLLQKGTVIRSYAIAMGPNWDKGHKEREGDKRTPEGRYEIDWRNPQSKFHLSLHISYPNAQDRAQARAGGYSPGGDIMIHGMPNGFSGATAVLQAMDWTDGCIAVTNEEMQEIWALVPNGTPIEILPQWRAAL